MVLPIISSLKVSLAGLALGVGGAFSMGESTPFTPPEYGIFDSGRKQSVSMFAYTPPERKRKRGLLSVGMEHSEEKLPQL